MANAAYARSAVVEYACSRRVQRTLKASALHHLMAVPEHALKLFRMATAKVQVLAMLVV